MRNLTRILLVLFCTLFTAGFLIADELDSWKHSLLPVPESVELGERIFRLDSAFTISIRGQAHDRLYSYSTRVLRQLSGRTGLFFPQDVLTRDNMVSGSQTDLIIESGRPGVVELHENESYRLEVLPEQILLSAETDIGAIRGLETLLQLLTADDEGYYFPEVHIDDQPRFPWRGLLIDPCRHWMPVDVIKRNLDAMAAVKMNVLHWHLTEDQGFRVESHTFPKLHQMGSDGNFYTQEQIRDIIAYAGDRGIRVVPEFDIPGHTTSWFVGYPELASAPGPYTIERHYGIMNPAMNPAQEYTYEFLDQFLSEMAELFPDEYMHIGGDEVGGDHWDANEQIQEFMKENGLDDNHELQAYFNRRVLEILTDNEKKMVGWDEIFQPELPQNIVIQSWRGQEALIDAAKRGYQTMLSNGYYIDLIQPADYHYLNDPVPLDADLTDEQKDLILGGETTMWAELVTPENVDSRIWPRTAALAERFWSPAEITDVDDMYRRLEAVSFQLEELGVTHEKNYRMMLRRLANGGDVEALKKLVDILEPIKGYRRHGLGTYTTYSPYTRVVDTARPDAPVARNFRKMVEDYLSGNAPELVPDIKEFLGQLDNNHGTLQNTFNQSPVLEEIRPVSALVSQLSQSGLHALEFLETGTQPGQQWFRDQQMIIGQGNAPTAEVEIMIIPAIEQLVSAVAQE